MTTSATPTPQALSPDVGLGVLHLFCRRAGRVDEAALLAAAKESEAAGDQVVAVSMLGHKADVGLMVLSPDLWRLRRFQSAVQASGLHVVSSYVSLTEVSEYAASVKESLKQARLYPTLPPEGKRAFCFYPMSKRRDAGANWYELDFEDRKHLMMSHGRIGRTFHDRVLQLITGSTGIDDWEWGVTLFAVQPGDLKDCVYQMRYDEASARYAEFGPFYTGMVAELGQVLDSSVGYDR